MRITFYQRRPQAENFSIERLFAAVRRALPDEDIEAKVRVSKYPSRGVWKRLYNVIEAAFRQSDVNHITGDVHYLTLLLNRKRTLLTIHDLVSVHRLQGLRKIIFLFFWYWLPIRRSALVTVISESTKKDLLRYIKVDPRKIRVVHNPLSVDFTPVPKEFNSLKPRILQIGTGQNKNIERVAAALENISCHLRIIGVLTAAQVAALRKYRVEYSFAENLPDEKIVEEYRCCDMVIFASTYEGFGLPIVEAQASGRPVVTSGLLSMPEVAGEAACIVDPFDIASIRSGVVKVITSPSYREDLVQRGFENVKRFHPDKIAREYLTIYRELEAG